VDNALLQVETPPTSERRFMELAIDEARKSAARGGANHRSTFPRRLVADVFTLAPAFGSKR